MLDDDAYPLPGAVETLVEAFEREPAARRGRRLRARRRPRRDVILRQTELGTFDWWLRAGQEGDAPPEGLPAFFFPEGACMLRRGAYLEVGGYFEPYFHASSEGSTWRRG